MDISELYEVVFFIKLGYVTLLASVLTVLVMQVVKKVLKKKKIINEEMASEEKDALLSKRGRYIAMILYTLIFLLNEYLLDKKIILDQVLLTGLLSGGAMTLTLSKGVYTSFRQWQKKMNVFEKLKFAELKIKELSDSLKQTDNLMEKTSKVSEVLGKEESKTWILKGGMKSE